MPTHVDKGYMKKAGRASTAHSFYRNYRNKELRTFLTRSPRLPEKFYMSVFNSSKWRWAPRPIQKLGHLIRYGVGWHEHDPEIERLAAKARYEKTRLRNPFKKSRQSGDERMIDELFELFWISTIVSALEWIVWSLIIMRMKKR